MRTTKNILAALLLGAPLLLPSTAGATGTLAPSTFGPASVSFVSSSRGFVLGTSPCAHAPCTAVMTTDNGGTSWSALGAPPAALTGPATPQSASTVSEIAFANPSDGWAFDPALWATSNGGARWHQEKLGGPVISLVAAGGYAYAAVASCYEGSSQCSPTVKLERSPVSQNVWKTVPGVEGRGARALFATQGAAVWVAVWAKPVGPASIWASATGTSWRRHSDPCYEPAQGIDVAGLASPGVNALFELCAGNPGAGQEGKSLRISTNGGATSHLVSNLPLGGLAYGIAANTMKVVVDAVSGASFLYHSANGGSTWGMKALNDGGAGLFDLQFATSGLGVVVEGHPGLGASANRLLITHDGGATWSASRP